MKINKNKTEMRKKQLADAISYTQQLKIYINEYSKQLDILYLDKKISTKDYEKNKKEIFKNRSLKQWNNYYDDYIKSYKNELKQLGSIDLSKISAWIFFIALFGIILFSYGTFTGYTIYDPNGSIESTVLQESASLSDDYATLSDYPNCPDSSGNVTISSSTVWSDSSYECNVITVSSDLYINSTGAGNTTINITANEIFVQGKIIADGFGYSGNNGPGSPSTAYWGGSYGGEGGSGTTLVSILAYGSVTEPLSLGSGGNNLVKTSGRGGGALFLNVSNNLVISGTISANGSSSLDGGGSGGSIYIITKNINGSGSILSTGGKCNQTDGGGGGGRIAIYYQNNYFTGHINATGGTSATATKTGGAGTIYLKDIINNHSTLYISNKNITTSQISFTALNSSFLTKGFVDSLNITEMAILYLENSSFTFNNTNLHISSSSGLLQNNTLFFPSIETFEVAGNLFLANEYYFNKTMNFTLYSGGNLSHFSNNKSKYNFINLSAKNFIVSNGAEIQLYGTGYEGNYGPGTQSTSYCGGSYGGEGGCVSLPIVGPYGSVTEPLDIGSGGKGINPKIGMGGGALYLNVSETFINNGIISVNGSKSTDGGGSGGSIYIRAQTFNGTGLIMSNGGTPTADGGGSGGRIAIYYETNQYSGDIQAIGGIGTDALRAGSAGTIYYMNTLVNHSTLLVSNGNKTVSLYARTRINSSFIDKQFIHSLNITDMAKVVLEDGSFTFNNSRFTLPADSYLWQNTTFNMPEIVFFYLSGKFFVSTNYTLNPLVSFMIYSNGTLEHMKNFNNKVYFINLSALNLYLYEGSTISADYVGFAGNYGPGASSVSNCGGSYGGQGGCGSASSSPYGSLTAPLDLGSGGKVASSANGLAGGLIYLNVSDTLFLNGNISANGSLSIDGGGSGGSVYIITDTIVGNGTISLQGGRASNANEGGGSGGRVAIYSDDNQFTGYINVSGGRSATATRYGSIGSIFLCEHLASVRCRSFDNGSVITSASNVQVKTNYSIISSINVTKIINETISKSSVNWTDQCTNISMFAEYNVSGLSTNATNYIYENLSLVYNLTTDMNGNLPLFNLTLNSNYHQVSIQNVSVEGAPSVVGITLDDSTIAFGSGHYDPSCTSDYGLLNSNTTNNCWFNTTEFPSLDDTHNITNNGTVNVNVSSYVILTDAEEAFCGTSQGCTLTDLAKISIISQDNEVSSCTGLNSYGTLASYNSNSTQGVCNSLGFSDSSNQIKTFIELFYPKDSTPGAKSITIVYEAIAV
ncbi:hypothetical protein J4403_04620 [Candidatus Woesearchaeota archaeon]|nr:hypothetical protein [Candidatus Woesearchaeota archaeon]